MSDTTISNTNNMVTSKTYVSVQFAGDSGDGMQLTGTQFANTVAVYGSDLNTFPNFPSEIRAPAGTISGVSGFQLQFGSEAVYTPGAKFDVMVAMNAAALKSNLKNLHHGGIIIANTDGFDAKNLKLSGYGEENNPLKDGSLKDYTVFEIPVVTLTRKALADTGLSTKNIDRCKNMFVLGVLYWLYSLPIDTTIETLRTKFKKKADIAEANIKAVKAGYNFGDETEMFSQNGRFTVDPAQKTPGVYRRVTGNEASAIGLAAAAKKAGLQLFLGSYPITPASEILQTLSGLKKWGVKTFQAEDEIAGVLTSIGASYGGALAATNTSGPGLALKSEGLGLAMILEVPLVVVNVQRGGPSTGLPTKPEQSDLFIAMFGRHGDAPVPVIAATSPVDCFYAAYEAAKIAVEYMTPVICLTDGYLALSSEPMLVPAPDDLAAITPKFAQERKADDPPYLPYKRDERCVREWAKPGTPGLEHRIGGLEKQHETGHVSHDPANHALMTKLRAEKVERVADIIPDQTIDNGPETGDLLVLGWGSTYGAIKIAVNQAIEKGYSVAHAHLRYMNPMPKNLGDILSNYKKVLIPENNSGQLIHLIRDKFQIEPVGFSKVQGLPFNEMEIEEKITDIVKEL
ncbi:2-oxoacid:acceptor oxidoreductase subunit alpha [Prosthecochloris sp. N3]|uniref:2-oxoacid:acceptor oxidoreductase subunit alpha n=1 Tax=Prosthecochloris ethylica TaxID=2743976 RepID=A0ABR9XU26_9CHLB|nr:2-oxoacid:acceptor oxidoreductase subunit alpha [Prosthecochloris ethylica]MBF0586442.1 2-oxoacid:acceptor oxidoreductase subunit alpha [Prosthecochloris ethylica]MBF0637561.1 2-oxoacid:acceptor oxidoreductase subunit alpha [Prosthecochloris ethylica]NUK47514.1 2-oxoacid:acceptor oxidoreductase subunit alpha [Prosthecochloris ethylica]